MGAKNLDVVITVIAVILVVLVWIMLYDSNRFVVRHYFLRDQRIKKPVKAVVLADLHNKRYGNDPDRRRYSDGKAEGKSGDGGGPAYEACREISDLLRQRQS